MQLLFSYLPAKDLPAALALYRDTLGLDELWREGDATVAFAVPGTDVALMVDGAAEDGWGPGPMFLVPSVVDFWAARGDALDVAIEPVEIPGGMISAFRDPGGNFVYVMDQSTAPEEDPAGS
jgi:catechol 2,3-dioxygenase-like lactoylglutathione lyase family enzyme